MLSPAPSLLPAFSVVEMMLPWQPPALVFFALRDIPAGQELSVDYRPADNTEGRERYSNTVREGNWGYTNWPAPARLCGRAADLLLDLANGW
jgi:hypothetical protein